MITADSSTLSALSRAASAAAHEGCLSDLVERLELLASLDTPCVLFTEHDGIHFVVFSTTFEAVCTGPLIIHQPPIALAHAA